MRKKALKLISVMLAIFMVFAAVPLSGLAGIDLPIFRASAVEETETEISGKLGTKLTWSIDKASKTLTIDNKGQMISFSTTEAPWKNYKSYFDAVVINEGCANVGGGAFSGCENIVSVDLPSSINTIDRSAFSGCGIKKAEIPYGVTSIEEFSFEGCEQLTTIELPDSVKVIGYNAFGGCSSLERVVIPDSVTNMDSSVFSWCTALSEVSLGSGITTIWNNAFAGCTNLSIISIPYNCTQIWGSAFAGCSNLSKIYIYNKGCSINQDAIPITATIYGFTGSTTEDFATQYGYNFVSIDVPCEHEYSNDCDNSCNKCGEIRDAAHSFGEWTVEREATCSQTGLQIRTCSVCGAIEREALPLIDHTDANDDGICDICKKQFALRYPKNGVCGPKLTWTLDDDGVLTIEGTGEMYDFYNGDSILVSDDLRNPIETSTRSYTESDDVPGPTAPWPNESSTRSDTTKGDASETSRPDSDYIYTRTPHVITHPYYSDYDNSNQQESTTVRQREEETTAPRPESTTAPARLRAAAKRDYSADETKYVADVTETRVAPDGYIRVFRWNLHFDDIKKVVIGEGVTNISVAAFKDCQQLSEVKIADSVKYIGQEAFYGCSSLKEISIPKNVESIGYRAFGSCELLSTLDYDAVNCPCGYYWDDNVNWFDNNTVIKTLYIGSNVKKIPKIKSIQTAIFKDGVTKIPNGAFYGFVKLTTVSLPETLTEIGVQAFYNCKSIREITIPARVTYIDYNAFENCESLEVLNFNAFNCAYYRRYGQDNVFCNSPVKTLNVGNAVNTLPHIATLERVTFAEGTAKVPNDLFESCSNLFTVNLPSTITEIGSGAFANCISLTNIAIPKDVNYIGNGAFSNCSALTNVDIPTALTEIGERAFEGCTSLESISIPTNVTKICDMAFRGCSAVKELTIPERVTYVGYKAFGSCSSLATVNFNAENCSKVYKNAFMGCPVEVLNIGKVYGAIPRIITIKTVTFADGAVKVPDDAFSRCADLTDVNLPDSIKSIGAHSFEYCERLQSIYLPKDLEVIGEKAFFACYNLRNAKLPSSLTRIENGVFDNCTSLSDIAIPNSVEYIGDYAFYGCVTAPSVNIPAKVSYIGNGAFGSCNAIKSVSFDPSVKIDTIGAYTFGLCTNIETMILPQSVKTIKSRAFYNCSSLKEINLSSAETIQGGAFLGCSSLTELTIPASVKSIGYGAFDGCSSVEVINYNAEDCEISNYYIFANCTAVKTVNIGSTVRSIPAYTFSGCSNLERAYFPDIAVQIDPLAFFGCGNVAIVCPNGSYANVYAIQNGIKYILEDGVNDTAFEIRNGMLLGYSGSAQNIVLPSDLNSVGIGAFDGNSVVRSIEIPYNISKIYSNAFANCPNLEQVIIPFTVTDISSSAFNGTNAVIYCYYNSYAYKFAMENNIKCELITVTLSENSVSTFAGGAAAVKAVPSVTVASGIPLVWRSADPTVADVDSKGNIVGKSEGNTTVGVYSLGGNLLAECKVSVSKRIDFKFATPSTATVKYGEKLILHIDTSTLPEGTAVEWSISDSNAFRLSDESAACTLHQSCVTCTVESIAKGSATITAKVVDKNGNAVKDANGNEIAASQQLTSKAGFFQKLVAFFKKLFGSNMVIPSSLNKLIK